MPRSTGRCSATWWPSRSITRRWSTRPPERSSEGAMTGWLDRLVDRLTGRGLPAGFPGRLAGEERVLAWARAGENDQLVATSLGLWMPDGAGSRRVGWHLISKATWGGGTLVVTEAAEIGTVEDAVLLADRPARRFRLGRSVGLPEAVHARVTGSIKSSHHR